MKNESQGRRKISLGFDLRAGVTVKREKPWFIDSSAEADNKLTPSESHGCVIFEAQHSRAVSVQGVWPRPARIEQGRMLVHEFSLNPGETRSFHYLNLIGEDKDATLDAYDRQQANFDRLLKENEERFAGILRQPSRRETRNSRDTSRNSSLAAGSSGGSTMWVLPIF